MLSLGQRWITMLVAKLDQAAYEGVPAEQVRADLEAAEPGLHALVRIGVPSIAAACASLSRGEHRAVGLFGGPTSDRQTVA